MPFKPSRAQLKALASHRSAVIATIEPFYPERLLADQVYSTKRIHRMAFVARAHGGYLATLGFTATSHEPHLAGLE